jgi:hypothetical protein
VTDTRKDFPRPLSEREATTLEFLLSVDDPRALPLREQSRYVVVNGMCPCGCATVSLEVDRPRAKPATELAHLRMAIESNGPGAGESPILSFLLFLDEGWLDSLEISYIGSVAPAVFPPTGGFDPPRIAAQ